MTGYDGGDRNGLDDPSDVLDTLIDCLTSFDVHGDVAAQAAKFILGSESGLTVAVADAAATGPDDTDPRIAAAVRVLNGWSELHNIDVRTVTCGCGEKLGTLLDAEKHLATEKARRVLAAADAVDPRDTEIERLRRALAMHLFDREALSTREAIRSELITMGFAAAERAERAEAERDRLRAALGKVADFAEQRLYDGDNDRPLPGYYELLGLAALREAES